MIVLFRRFPCKSPGYRILFIGLSKTRSNGRRNSSYQLYRARQTITNRSCINLEHTLLNTRNRSYTGQSQSGILFLHQLLSPTQYLPSSVGSPLFRRAQPPVAVIASGSWRLISRSRNPICFSLISAYISLRKMYGFHRRRPKPLPGSITHMLITIIITYDSSIYASL